jgi:hypothetical protein
MIKGAFIKINLHLLTQCRVNEISCLNFDYGLLLKLFGGNVPNIYWSRITSSNQKGWSWGKVTDPDGCITRLKEARQLISVLQKIVHFYVKGAELCRQIATIRIVCLTKGHRMTAPHGMALVRPRFGVRTDTHQTTTASLLQNSLTHCDIPQGTTSIHRSGCKNCPVRWKFYAGDRILMICEFIWAGCITTAFDPLPNTSSLITNRKVELFFILSMKKFLGHENENGKMAFYMVDTRQFTFRYSQICLQLSTQRNSDLDPVASVKFRPKHTLLISFEWRFRVCSRIPLDKSQDIISVFLWSILSQSTLGRLCFRLPLRILEKNCMKSD